MDVAHNLLMANQKNSLLIKMRKARSERYMISLDSDPSNDSDSSIRSIDINKKERHRNKSMDLSNSSYSSSHSIEDHQKFQEPFPPAIRRSSSIDAG